MAKWATRQLHLTKWATGEQSKSWEKNLKNADPKSLRINKPIYRNGKLCFGLLTVAAK